MSNRLAEYAADDDVARISSLRAAQTLLHVVCQVTGVRFAAIAKLTENHWIACAVRDGIEIGLRPGDAIALDQTICQFVKQSGAPVIIDNLPEDQRFKSIHKYVIPGMQSYISVPVRLADGRFFGSLCAAGPQPLSLSAPQNIAMFEMFADMLGMHLSASHKITQLKTRKDNFFTPAPHDHLKNHSEIQADLRNAITRNEFVLMYQPMVRLADGQITGAEALLRWRHGSRGLLTPDKFIPAAEATGLILPIGQWVLQTACKQAASWASKIPVAVNVSAVQFHSSPLATQISAALQAAKLPPSRLAIEITESVLLLDNKQTQQTIAALDKIGVTIAMDDFGAGYSSLRYLQKFPIGKIKIDKQFTQSAAGHLQSREIIKAIVALGKGLGASICAEGAETTPQLTALAELGVAEVQGFALYKPMTAQNFAALLQTQESLAYPACAIA
jgi:EAL domain-containing protein (putative c-di-GMP-specific phosphodiesterase class I)